MVIVNLPYTGSDGQAGQSTNNQEALFQIPTTSTGRDPTLEATMSRNLRTHELFFLVTSPFPVKPSQGASNGGHIARAGGRGVSFTGEGRTRHTHQVRIRALERAGFVLVVCCEKFDERCDC